MVEPVGRPYRRAMGRRTRLLGLTLGGLLVVLGIVEATRAVTSGDGGVLFWFGCLVGGGALVLWGTLQDERYPGPALAATVVGCVAGCVPTMWTLVVPLALLFLAVVRLMGPTGTAVGTDGPPAPG